MLDLLFASSGIEKEVCEDAERLQVFPDVVCPIGALHHLVALKLLARDDRTRPQDAADLRQLLAVARPSDLDAARSAVQLIEARGFSRSRNLVEALTDACREFLPGARA
jgi:hypothetical protein